MLKRTLRIELDITVNAPDAPDGTPDTLQSSLIEAYADWISGMLRIEADRIAELKGAEVGDFIHWIDD